MCVLTQPFKEIFGTCVSLIRPILIRVQHLSVTLMDLSEALSQLVVLNQLLYPDHALGVCDGSHREKEVTGIAVLAAGLSWTVGFPLLTLNPSKPTL